MDVVLEVLKLAKDFSPIGVVALMAVAFIVAVWKNPFTPIAHKLDTIMDNHLHDLPSISANMAQMADGIDKIADTMQRLEVKLSEDLSHIKAKVDDR